MLFNIIFVCRCLPFKTKCLTYKSLIFATELYLKMWLGGSQLAVLFIPFYNSFYLCKHFFHIYLLTKFLLILIFNLKMLSIILHSKILITHTHTHTQFILHTYTSFHLISIQKNLLFNKTKIIHKSRNESHNVMLCYKCAECIVTGFFFLRIYRRDIV